MNFFAQNRSRLLKSLNFEVPILMTAYHEMQLSGDAAAPFAQEANFWWLCGVDKPDWKLIIEPNSDLTLVAPKLSDEQLVFNGGIDYDALIDLSGAHKIIAQAEFNDYMKRLRKKYTKVLTFVDSYRYEFIKNPALCSFYILLKECFDSVDNIEENLQNTRAIKSPAEIELVKSAVRQTIEAFNKVRHKLKDYNYEYQIESEITYCFRSQNFNHAYQPIVAAGKNATTLHYQENNCPVAAQDLVLIDTGARQNGYCADISRTYSTKPTPRQAAVHAAVQKALTQIVELIKPNLAIKDYINYSDRIMKEALNELGLLQSFDDNKAFRRYFPHAISHGLGVETHDSLGAAKFFAPNMIITVEPGIYIPEEGIGVRLEDDILITNSGCDNLGAALSNDL